MAFSTVALSVAAKTEDSVSIPILAPGQGADVRIDLVSSYTPPLCPGSVIGYKAALFNESSAGSTLLPASIRSNIAAGTTYIQGSATGDASYDPSSNQIVWVGRLEPGASHIIEFQVMVGSAAGDGTAIAGLANGMIGETRVEATTRDVVDCRPRTDTPTPTHTPTEPVIVNPSNTPTPTPTPTQPVIGFPTSTPTRTPTPTPTQPVIGFPTSTPTPQKFAIPTVDITITNIEVSQGIQNLDNDMPLVKDRRTVVRAYVRDLTGKNGSGIRARLYGTRNGQALPSSPLSPRNTTSNHAITVHPDGGDRLDLDDSFWFTLPGDWRSGTVTLRAVVNYNLKAPEGNLANNEKSTTVSFRTAYTFNITNGTGSIDEVVLQQSSKVFSDNLAQAQIQLAGLRIDDFSDFALEIQDATGSALERRPLSISDSEDADVSSYLELLPWPAEAQQIALINGTDVLTTTSPSPNPPHHHPALAQWW